MPIKKAKIINKTRTVPNLFPAIALKKCFIKNSVTNVSRKWTHDL